MIKAYISGATAAQLTTFLTNRSANVTFYSTTSHLSGTSFPTGVVAEFDEPDINWQEVKTTLTDAMAPVTGVLAGGIAKIRVMFDADDSAKTAGRHGARHFWLNSDGSQSEF